LANTAAFIGPPKTAKSLRTIPLADVVLAELAEHIRRFPPQPVRVEDRTNPARPVWREALLVFTYGRRGPIIRQSFNENVWRRACVRTGVPESFTYHDLRHFYASALIRFGESVKTVSERLGHANAAETLNTYSHLWPDSADRSRTAIDDAFSGGVGQMWAEGSG
jgi:integrase